MYKVLTSNSAHILEEKVNKYRKEGYSLQGGVSVSSSTGLTIFAQAVIKDDEKEAKVIPIYPEMFGQRHRDNVPSASVN